VSNCAIAEYLSQTQSEQVNAPLLAYLATLTEVARTAPGIAKAIVQELADQRANLKLIASENYCSMATQLAMGNLLTDKYAEGVPGHRHYEGCDNVDTVEERTRELACALFGCEHAYVQPHSGADANLIAYWAILRTRVEMPALARRGLGSLGDLTDEDWAALRATLGNQRLLGMDYYAGGHLTHGYRHNVSAKMFDAHTYAVDRDTGRLDYDVLEQQVRAVRPLILVAGYSSYPRAIDFRRLRQMADQVGAVFLVDMAHFAGLVAGGVFEGDFNPIPHAHVVTTTTHKTLRGPRGGLVLCTAEFAESVDRGCPLVIGGPLGHVIAAKAVALKEASTPAFKAYARQILDNARHLAEAYVGEGLDVVTGGTDNHLMLIDVRACGLTGRQAAGALRRCGITVNYNALPNDPNGPVVTSGLRIGTPAVTTLGMGDAEMRDIAAATKLVLDHTRPAPVASGPRTGEPSKTRFSLDESAASEARARVKALLDRFPVYPELDLALLQKHFG